MDDKIGGCKLISKPKVILILLRIHDNSTRAPETVQISYRTYVHNSIIRYVGYSCRIYGAKYHSKITAVIHATCAHVLEYIYIYIHIRRICHKNSYLPSKTAFQIYITYVRLRSNYENGTVGNILYVASLLNIEGVEFLSLERVCHLADVNDNRCLLISLQGQVGRIAVLCSRHSSLDLFPRRRVSGLYVHEDLSNWICLERIPAQTSRTSRLPSFLPSSPSLRLHRYPANCSRRCTTAAVFLHRSPSIHASDS